MDRSKRRIPAGLPPLGLALLASLPIACAVAGGNVREVFPPPGDFYAKYLDCQGIPVRSSAAVEDAALELACGKITMMLGRIPSVRAVLIRRGAELHLIGRNERTSDLPEFRDQRDKVYTDEKGSRTTIDARTRGKGGLRASCGEENVLHLANDRYRGVDICVHEFSHAIMNNGFTAEERRRIEEQYRDALANGLWRGSYAATDSMEYWAELSMWYFGGHGDRRMSGPPPADGPEGLRAYDPAGYDLVASLYGGRQ